MNEEINKQTIIDPTKNVIELVVTSIKRLDDLRGAEIKRAEDRFQNIDDKFRDNDTKYQIQFTAAKEAVSIASTAQEKLVAQALDGTKEAINKADLATDKRFELLAEKITGLSDILNKNSGASAIYVTHADLTIALDKLQTNIEITLRPVVTFMNNSSGKSQGMALTWGTMLSVVALIASLIAVGTFFFNNSSKSDTVQPQIMYLQAPAPTTTPTTTPIQGTK